LVVCLQEEAQERRRILHSHQQGLFQRLQKLVQKREVRGSVTRGGGAAAVPDA
jgi:hypothetical protein